MNRRTAPEIDIDFVIDDPERYIAAITPYGKYYDLLGEKHTYNISEVDLFVFDHTAEDSLEEEILSMDAWGMMERATERSGVYEPSYRPAREENWADALFSWRTVRDSFDGKAWKLLEEDLPESAKENISFVSTS